MRKDENHGLNFSQHLIHFYTRAFCTQLDKAANAVLADCSDHAIQWPSGLERMIIAAIMSTELDDGGGDMRSATACILFAQFGSHKKSQQKAPRYWKRNIL